MCRGGSRHQRLEAMQMNTTALAAVATTYHNLKSGRNVELMLATNPKRTDKQAMSLRLGERNAHRGRQ